MSEERKVSENKYEDFDLETDRCLYCNERFRDKTIYEKKDHKEGCCWKYYLVCVSCGKENSLAHLVKDNACTCE